MKRFLGVAVAVLLLFSLFGCAQSHSYQDGIYSAEFRDFDSRGYKDYLKVTVSGGKVTDIVFDGVDAEGNLKSQDADYKSTMEELQGTYPEKYATDLENQYLDMSDIEKVDAVAGATYSSESFIALFHALEKSMESGDSKLVVIDNIVER